MGSVLRVQCGLFVMPGTTFLPIAGPVGSALGLGLGGLVMLVLAVNFHYLMNRYPDCGGIYTYTKKAFGYDHGFLSAWFLIITYIAIIWANATALPLIARTVLGDTFRFGYLYEIAGYKIYVGEILLSAGALIAATVVCFFRRLSACTQVVLAAVGLAGMVISVLFAPEFLIPNILSINTLSLESYFILTIWSILGFLYFRVFLHRDKERKMGHSILAWIVLLGLIIFTSSVWMRQTTDKALLRSENAIADHYGADNTQDNEHIKEQLDTVGDTLNIASSVQIALICFSLIILLRIYFIMQKREKQMKVEKALAEESSRAKTSFLSNMSHEIRTPMNAIIGLDNIALRDPDLPPRTREQLEKIGASANHLLGLINDILDMSRIESGRMVLKNEEFSFREFLDQIYIIINGQCQDKGLHYDCKIAGNVNDYYFGDDMKLKQVMINILGNSVKFTETPGSVTLTAEQTAQKDGICTLRFVMKDTDIGDNGLEIRIRRGQLGQPLPNA